MPVGTICAPLLSDLSFTGMNRSLSKGLKKGKKILPSHSTSPTYDNLPLSNSRIPEFIYLIYTCDFKIKDTSESS